MLPLSLNSKIRLLDLVAPPCFLAVPTFLSLSVSINTCVHALWELCRQPARSFLTSLFFHVGHLWKNHWLPWQKTIFVYHMFAHKTTKQLCVLVCFWLSYHWCTFLSLTVVCDCLWRRRTSQVQQHFGRDHRSPAIADSNLHSGGIQVPVFNSSCKMTPLFVLRSFEIRVAQSCCFNEMKLESISLNTLCVFSVIGRFSDWVSEISWWTVSCWFFFQQLHQANVVCDNAARVKSLRWRNVMFFSRQIAYNWVLGAHRRLSYWKKFRTPPSVAAMLVQLLLSSRRECMPLESGEPLWSDDPRCAYCLAKRCLPAHHHTVYPST